MRILRTIGGAIVIMLFIAGGIAIGIYWQSRPLADLLAENMFVHSSVPEDFELPPTAYPISYTGTDVQILGGQGKGISCSIPPAAEEVIFGRPKRILADVDRDRHGFPLPAPSSLDFARNPAIGAWVPEFWPSVKRNRVVASDSVATQMRQGCAFHDYCYRHGAATYGYSQSDCDHILLEHAYRLCRYTGLAGRHEQCLNTARKVVLGVRMFGNSAFKAADTFPSLVSSKDSAEDGKTINFDDAVTSTYFEFDPYPVRSKGFHAYRIAQTPPGLSQPGTLRKALYEFVFKYNRIRLRIEAFDAPESGNQESGNQESGGLQRSQYCEIELPVESGFVNAPPQVARSNGGKRHEEDWFAWWRRIDLNQTGGHLALLNPARASLADWQLVFPGASIRPVGNQDCLETTQGVDIAPAESNDVAGDPEKKSVAKVGLFQIGNKFPEDPVVNEIRPAPHAATDGHLRFFAIQPTSCDSRQHVLCYVDVDIDLEDLPEVRSSKFIDDKNEPRSIRDSYAYNYSLGERTSERRENLRYRNHVFAPFSYEMDGDVVFAWLKRGTVYDIDHGRHALLRRAISKGTGSESAGIVKIADLSENMEPLLITGRKSGEPELMAIYVEGNEEDSSVRLARWRLPKSRNLTQKKASDLKPLRAGDARSDERLVPCFSGIAQQAKRHCVAILAQSQPFEGEACDLSVLDESWLRRPPVMLPYDQESSGGNGNIRNLVLLSRLTSSWVDVDGSFDPANPPYHGPVLEIRWLWILKGGQCVIQKTVSGHKLDLAVPRIGQNRDTKWEARYPSTFLRIVRQTPVLVDFVDGNDIPDLILPFANAFYEARYREGNVHIRSKLFLDVLPELSAD